MASIPAYTGKVVKSSLESKGFQLGKGDHHQLFLMVDGKRTPIRTKISHGRKMYTDGLWKCLKDQLKLTNEELHDFLRCALNYDGYISLLISKNIIASPRQDDFPHQ
jgi:hypothetical protein